MGESLSASGSEQLANALVGLPLALEQAGTFLIETGMPIDEYLRLLNESPGHIMDVGVSPAYPVSMATAWRASAAALSEQLPAAMELLRVCAFFGPEPIPSDLLRRGVASTPGLAEVLKDPILLARAIRELGRFALIAIHGRTISVHRLIQALIRDELSAEQRTRSQHEAHVILASGAPGDPADTATWPQYQELLPHVAAEASELERCQDAQVRAFVVNVLAYLCLSGTPSVCLTLAERFVAQWTQDTGPDDYYVLDARYHQGTALRLLGRYPEARQVTGEALARSRSALGAEHPLTQALTASALTSVTPG
jgi:hypothetical protein